MGPVIIVQRVVTEWTKRSRGVPGAVRRNAVAEAFPLGRHVTGEVLVHQVTAREEDGFAIRETSASHPVPAAAPLRLDGSAGVRLELAHGELAVIGVPESWSHGFVFPNRPSHTVMRLPAGRWGRWRLNFRLWDGLEGSEWRYQKWVVNVAHLTRPPAPYLFTTADPDLFTDDMIRLARPTRWSQRSI